MENSFLSILELISYNFILIADGNADNVEQNKSYNARTKINFFFVWNNSHSYYSVLLFFFLLNQHSMFRYLNYKYIVHSN